MARAVSRKWAALREAASINPKLAAAWLMATLTGMATQTYLSPQTMGLLIFFATTTHLEIGAFGFAWLALNPTGTPSARSFAYFMAAQRRCEWGKGGPVFLFIGKSRVLRITSWGGQYVV